MRQYTENVKETNGKGGTGVDEGKYVVGDGKYEVALQSK